MIAPDFTLARHAATYLKNYKTINKRKAHKYPWLAGWQELTMPAFPPIAPTTLLLLVHSTMQKAFLLSLLLQVDHDGSRALCEFDFHN